MYAFNYNLVKTIMTYSDICLCFIFHFSQFSEALTNIMNRFINTQTLPIFDSKLYSTKNAHVDDSFSTFVYISVLDVYTRHK